MRVRVAAWMGGVIAASAAVSAVALGQGSTWGTSAGSGARDAGVNTATSDDAGTGTEAGTEAEAGTATGAATDAGTETDADAAADNPAPYQPSNVGFAIGLRAGYGVPFGTANGSPLRSVALGVVPLAVEGGLFVSPRFYVGGYFVYGFGVGADHANDTCTGGNTQCSATMLRLGLLAHWHLNPLASWDPWLGAGLGYETILLSAKSSADGSSVQSAGLRGLDLSLEAGLDLKPLRYVGLGPYVELATGPYFGTESFAMHGWLTFGARFRTNL